MSSTPAERATRCTISLTVTEQEVGLTVVNDGANAGQSGWGNGLTGLAERLGALDGRLSAGAEDGRFTLAARLPLRAGA